MAYHHGHLREALLTEAENIFDSYGESRLSLREIARATGVSHNAPYRHFRDKNHLFCELVKKNSDELAQQMLSAPLLYPVSVIFQIQFIGRLFGRVAWKYPRRAKFIFGLSPVFTQEAEIQNDELQIDNIYLTNKKLYLSNISFILEQAKMSGELINSTNVYNLSTKLYGYISGLCMDRACTPREKHDEEEIFYSQLDEGLADLAAATLND